jgi:Ca2+-binding EF-hand superfamily protein
VEAFDENKDGEISFDELYGLVSGERLATANESVRQLVEKMLPKDVDLPWTTFATVHARSLKVCSRHELPDIFPCVDVGVW